MKNKKGFTLIELLAVIVILAIIALIATPIILNIINNSRNSAIKRSADTYLNQIEKNFIIQQLKNNILGDGKYIVDNNGKLDEIDLQLEGQKPTDGFVIIKNNKITKATLKYEDIWANYDGNEIKLEKNKLDLNLPIMSKNYLTKVNLSSNNIESVSILTTKVAPTGLTGYDVSEKTDGSVILWYEDKDNNNLYEVYIGGEGGVSAPADFSSFFSGFISLNFAELINLDTSNVENMEDLFASAGTKNLELDLSGWDTSKVINMHGMFCWANFKNINFGNWDTSSVENMSNMFNGTKVIDGLDLNNFDTNNVITMENMFYLANVSSLSVNKFNTSNVDNMSGMFQMFSISTILNLDGWDTSNVEDMSEMFAYNSKLNDLNIKSFNMDNVNDTSNMFSYTTNMTIIANSTIQNTIKSLCSSCTVGI